MAWESPKTTWVATDYLNITDYNRIKNNISYLRDFADTLYHGIEISNMGNDKTYEDFYYADELNVIEDNLESINEGTYSLEVGMKDIFEENGTFIDYFELNRIEGLLLDIYDKLNNEIAGRRYFKWNFGMDGGL